MKLIIEPYMEPIIASYYKNNAEKLRHMVDKILNRLHFYNIDKEDFYSLANEIFVGAIKDYKREQSFDGFLYSCLYKKFCTDMTGRNRDKRCIKIKSKEKDASGNVVERVKIVPEEYLDAPVGDDEDSTLGDTIAGNYTVEEEIFERSEEGYSKRMLLYLSKLSNLQRQVLRLSIAGYVPNEIREALQISQKQYADCYAAIHSYRNVSALF